MTDKRYYLLQTADEVDAWISDAQLEAELDWFPEGESMPTDEYLDRLFRDPGPACGRDGYDECDLDSLDNEAARRIMSRARKLRKERDA